ncbi:MAG: hypothetical protein ABIP49_06730 [Lysobacterales bacterium]
MQRPTMSGALQVTLALMLTALLVACGDGIRELINPPGASVQQLRADAQGPWQVTLRLQNFSNVRTEFASVDLALFVGGVRAGTLKRSAALAVEADSVELVQFELAPTAAAREALAAPSVREAGIAYRLEGRLVTSEPRGSYPLSHDSRLTPVPGRAGEYR